MKRFVTKYALKRGIEELEGELCEGGSLFRTGKPGWSEYFHEKEHHDRREEAVLVAEQMRAKKIASLEKQLAKLRKLTFE